MKTNYIPAIVMLIAGLIDCILAIYYHQEMGVFTRQLLIVLLIFLFIGQCIKATIDRFFKEEKKIETSDETEDLSQDDADKE